MPSFMRAYSAQTHALMRIRCPRTALINLFVLNWRDPWVEAGN